jgi:NAD(P)-dependent dehydrogenase (short-subunit alcohol dehydrogenase family)
LAEGPAKVVVITGSTRGIGYGLAHSFLTRGCCVVVGGRSQAGTDLAVRQLADAHDPGSVTGEVCDVRDFGQVQGLWDGAIRRFGHVDIWINNAGLGTCQRDLWTHTPEEMAALVDTNVLGVLHGAKVAIEGMLAQGRGAVYTMEGLGSDGRRIVGLVLYGTTKRALRYLTEGLVAETRRTAVLVGSISPGMVTTDFLLSRYDHNSEDWERAKRIFNILADRVETVTPWIADRVLANTKHGARFEWLTLPRVAWRFLSAPFTHRDVVSDP